MKKKDKVKSNFSRVKKEFKRKQLMRNTIGSIALVGNADLRKKIAISIDKHLGKLRTRLYRQPRKLISIVSDRISKVRMPSNKFVNKFGQIYSNIRGAKFGEKVSVKEMEEFDTLVDSIANFEEKKNKEKHFTLPESQHIAQDTPEYFDLGRGGRKAKKMIFDDNAMNWEDYDH